MTSIDHITLEVADPTAAKVFYTDVLGLGAWVRVRAGEEPTSGFRGFTLSLIVSQPADVRALVDAAVAAGATTLKPAEKSLFGYGGSVRAPDGTIVTVASQSKKDTGPATRQIDDVVIQLGVADVAAAKRFYVASGFTVGRSFGSKYVEFAAAAGTVKLSLLKRKALAKAAGVGEDGTGSHRVVFGGAAAPMTDPDGFVWEPAVTAR
ncbi:glyoxalase [Actinoplanes sp. NPDC024001]|uniref:glyoxalase n=1 Tax=Actinoplanes sp. NPDC024001 TaxID=3154598 RepID=UPI0033D38EE2